MASSRFEIVTGAQLPNFSGKKVSVSGIVSDVTPGGTSFNLRSSDNLVIPVSLKSPLTSPLEGCVQVHGVSQGKTILAEEFFCFENPSFDVKSYNALCKLLYSVPNLWQMQNN